MSEETFYYEKFDEGVGFGGKVLESKREAFLRAIDRLLSAYPYQKMSEIFEATPQGSIPSVDPKTKIVFQIIGNYPPNLERQLKTIYEEYQ